MRYQVFQVYTVNSHEDAETLNQFLKSHQVISIDREFVADGQNSFWSFCVAVEDSVSAEDTSLKRNKRGVVDYREVLSPEVFSVYAKLRSFRNQLAEQQSTPPYAIFTNEQLAQMAKIDDPSKSALAQIEGVGEKRLSLYAEQFVTLLQGKNG